MKSTKMFKALLGGGILLLGFALVGQAAAQTCTPPPAGMVSWWPGDGNANDIADSNNGALEGGVSFGAGKVGQGFNFGGINGVVAVPDTPTLDITGDITIDAWINPAVIVGDQRVIASKRSFNNNDANIIFFLESNGLLAFASRSGGGPFAQVNSLTTIPLNQFTHVAVTIQGTTLNLYINGQLDQTFSYSSTRPANDGRFTIGLLEIDPGSFPPTGQFAPFNGVIDELEVFNRALSGTEIQAIFNAGSAGKCKPFAAFAAKVEIDLGPLPNDDKFEMKAKFTLGTGNNGIAPLTEAVIVQIGTFSATIPAGFFHQDKKGRFKLDGIVDGVALEAVIRPLGGGSFEFKAEGQRANLTGTVNPVTVGLTIGDDGGSTSVTAEFQ